MAPTQHNLCASPEEVKQVRATVSAEKRPALPDIIPGFKAASIDFSPFFTSFVPLFIFGLRLEAQPIHIVWCSSRLITLNPPRAP